MSSTFFADQFEECDEAFKYAHATDTTPAFEHAAGCLKCLRNIARVMWRTGTEVPVPVWRANKDELEARVASKGVVS